MSNAAKPAKRLFKVRVERTIYILATDHREAVRNGEYEAGGPSDSGEPQVMAWEVKKGDLIEWDPECLVFGADDGEDVTLAECLEKLP